MSFLQEWGPYDELDHSNRQTEFIVVAIVFTVIATIFGFGRLYTRLFVVRSFKSGASPSKCPRFLVPWTNGSHPDDWCIFLAVVSSGHFREASVRRIANVSTEERYACGRVARPV